MQEPEQTCQYKEWQRTEVSVSGGVHHLEDSRSQRILRLLEELGIDYEIEKYQRDPETSLAPPEMLKLHPLGKAPIVTDGGNTLAESKPRRPFALTCSEVMRTSPYSWNEFGNAGRISGR